MSEELIPIGTEYWGDWVYDIASTSPFEKRFKYRVIDHVWAKSYPHPDAPSHLVEEIEVIEKEERYPSSPAMLKALGIVFA